MLLSSGIQHLIHPPPADLLLPCAFAIAEFFFFAPQDVKMFKRRRWKYLILDEAHMIKNWRSLRWQALLNFSARHRLLITGTPLQNDLMELWSLMHFLMPHVFTSHAQFQGWFSNPLTGMVEGQASVNAELVSRLHSVLRPFVLRRMKKVCISVLCPMDLCHGRCCVP
jgi:SNF2 family DNA or RNA helicase